MNYLQGLTSYLDEQEKKKKKQPETANVSDRQEETIQTTESDNTYISSLTSYLEEQDKKRPTTSQPVVETKPEEPVQEQPKSFLDKAKGVFSSLKKSAGDAISSGISSLGKQIDRENPFTPFKQTLTDEEISQMGQDPSKLKNETYQREGLLERMGRTYNETLLLSLEDKYFDLNKLKEKDVLDDKDQKKLYKLEDEIREIEGSLDEPVTLGTLKKKEGTALKYGFQRKGEQVKAGLTGAGQGLVDVGTWFMESWADSREQLGEIQGVKEARQRLGTDKPREEDDVSQLLGKGAEKTRGLSKGMDKYIEENSSINPTIGESVTGGVASTAPFLVTGGLVSKIAGGSMKTVALTNSALESLQIAGNVYEENREQGKSVEEASLDFQKTFLLNLSVGYLTDRVGILNDSGRSKLTSAFMGASGEGIQEAYQQVIQNIHTDKDPFEGVIESGVIGGIVGSGFSVVIPNGKKVDITGGDIETPNITPDDEAKQKEDIDKFIQKFDEGLAGEVSEEGFRRPETITRDSGGKFSSGTNAEQRATVPEVEGTASSVISYVKDGKKYYMKLTPEEFSYLEKETQNIPDFQDTKNPIHLDAITPNLLKVGTELSKDEFVAGNPLAGELLQKAVTKTEGLVLMDEAKKYKSAEEFVNSKQTVDYTYGYKPEEIAETVRRFNNAGVPVKSGEDLVTLYHGTDAKGFTGINTSNTLNPFTYLATDRKASERFAYGRGGIVEIKVPAKDVPMVQTPMANAKGVTTQNIVPLVKGADGVWRAKELPTNQQLTDIWNKANGEMMSKGVDPLIAEARKYKSAEEFVKAQQPEKVTFKSAKANKDYMGGHEAPMAEDINAPIWDLTGKYTGNNLYPDDVYSSNARNLYSSGFDYDGLAMSILQSVKNRPNARVTVYRAVPKDIKGEINAGDWITLTRDYAKEHGESNLGGKYKIIKKEVFARDIFTDANSIQEFGYDPQPRLDGKDVPLDLLKNTFDAEKQGKKTIYSGYISQLTDIWNQANAPMMSKGVDPLIAEARKYKSAEEFVKDTLNKSNIGLQGEIKTIPVNKIRGTDYSELDDALSKNKRLSVKQAEDMVSATDPYKVGQKVKYPIEVLDNGDGTYSLTAGNHRLVQKLINGESDIVASVANKGGVSTKSQLTDIWNKANTVEEKATVTPSKDSQQDKTTDKSYPQDKTKDDNKKYQRDLNLNDSEDVAYLKRIFSEEVVNDMVNNNVFKYGRREGKEFIEEVINRNIIREETVDVEENASAKKTPRKKKAVKKTINKQIPESTFDNTIEPEVTEGVRDLNDLTVEEAREVLSDIKAVRFPELVRIAKELTGKVPELNSRFRRKLGVARTGKNFFLAEIELNPEIFQDEEVMGKVLAHEVGHIADYYPEGSLNRGNIAGRILTLQNFLRGVFTNPEIEERINRLGEEKRGLQEKRKAFKELENSTDAEKESEKFNLKRLKEVNKEINTLQAKAIKTEDVTKELIDLTTLWNPFNPEQDEDYTQYRYSSKELYAEAISVLLNQPTLLKTNAPKFWSGFFENIDRKPEVKKAFFDIWNLLNMGQEAVDNVRRVERVSMYEKGEDLYVEKIKEKQQKETNVKAFLRNTLLDKNSEAIKKTRQAKKQGKYVPDDMNPEYLLSDVNYMDGYISNFLEKYYQPVRELMMENNLDWEKDLGDVLFLERIANERGTVENPSKHLEEALGTELWQSYSKELPTNISTLSTTEQVSIMKKVFGALQDVNGSTMWEALEPLLPLNIANPQGYTQSTAREALKALEKELGVTRWNALQKGLEMFRDATEFVVQKADEEGIYSQQVMKGIKSNSSYATFQVLDYLDTNISASIKRQTGTLKDIASPTTSTVLKNISILKAVERNKAVRSLGEMLLTNFKEEVQEARFKFDGKRRTPLEPKESTLGLISYMKEGKLEAYYVDNYIAQATQFWGSRQMMTATKIVRILSGNKLFRPLFTSMNLGFQSFNLMRDAFRFYKNIPTIKWWQVWKPPVLYAKAVPASLRRATGRTDELIREMQESKILGITYNDVLRGMNEDDTQMVRVLQQYDLMKKPQRRTFLKPILAVLDVIEATGNFIETLPKVAGYMELKGTMPNRQLTSFLRTKVGSPDFLAKGTFTPVTNEMFLFSNAIAQSIRADLEIMTDPTTRGGYWVKNSLTTFMPKLLMMAMLYGLLGDDLKEMMRKASEYDRTNYTLVPLGLDENGKAVYLRIPQDETGRLLGAIFYKAMNGAFNDKSMAQDVQDIVSIAGGQIPSVTPSVGLLGATWDFITGRNPYDSFRGRNVIPETEFEAGGTRALIPFAEWLFNSAGGGVIMRSYSYVQADDTKTFTQKIIEAPILSNILGRWIKVTDYGETETLTQLSKSERQKKAERSLEIRDAVNVAVKEYRSGEQSIGRRTAVEGKLISDLFPKEERDSSTKAQITNTIKKFRTGVIKGEADPYVNSLIYAESNDEKKALIKKIYENSTEKEFVELRKVLLEERIVTPQVFGEAMKELK